MSKDNVILSKVLAGHDAGHFDLPPELLEYRAAEGKINAEYDAINRRLSAANPAAVRSRTVKELIAVAAAGELPAHYADPFLAEQEELRRAAAAQSILQEARLEVAERSPYAAVQMSEDILADYLRPALEQTLAAVRSGLDLADELSWGDTRALLRASKKARDYHEVVVQAHVRYTAIRDAQFRFKLLVGAPSDSAWHIFSELRNMPEVWPTRDSGVDQIRGKAPWPEDPLARMVWLVASDAEPWLPTAIECEDAYEALVANNPLRRSGITGGGDGFVAVPSGSGIAVIRG